jgi:hypothetical protein
MTVAKRRIDKGEIGGKALYCAAKRGRVVRRSARLVLGTLAIIIGLFAFGAAVAQAPGAGSSPSVAPGSFPAWAYPWAPDYKAAPDDGIPRHVPDSAAAFTITQERDLFLLRTGTLTIILPCRTSSPRGDLPTCALVDHVIVRRELEVQRTQVWPVFLPLTLFSRWPTTKAVPENFQVRRGAQCS